MPLDNFDKNRQRLVEAFYGRFLGGGRFETISQARSLAKEILNEPVNPGEPLAKRVEEALEQGILLAAKHIVECESNPPVDTLSDTYDRLVDLYQRQPILGTRTSSSIEKQQYSTPAPLSYLAGKLAGIDASKTVYEPTAGRGALLMLADPAKVIANELDPKRAADLAEQGYNTTQHDASDYQPTQQVDVVISNPPFGTRKGENGPDKFQIGAVDTPITTAEIDQAISWKALEAMKDDGKAVLIIGSQLGDQAERQKRYNTLNARRYFFNLYRQYHVTQHFTVDGDLYSRQGAKYPVDVIVIEGRKQQPFLDPQIDSRKLPGADPPQIYFSYTQLKEVLPVQSYEFRITQRSRAPAIHTESESLGTGGERNPTRGTSPTRKDRDSDTRTVSGTARAPTPSDGDRVRREPTADLAGDGENEVLTPLQGDSTIGRDERSGDPSGASNESPNQNQSSGMDRLPDTAPSREKRSRRERDLSSGQHQPRRVADSSNPLTPQKTMPTQSESNDSHVADQGASQIPYRPRSAGTSLDSYVPRNLEAPIQKALDNLEAKVGNVDQYVSDALNFGSVKNLHQALAAEQVDGVALALQSLQDGKAALIGDGTGLGKGRQMAAAIKYAMVTDRVPIFMTKDSGLYADIVRDLNDIGVKDIRPFMTNQSQTIPLPNGGTLKTSPTAHQRELRDMIKEGELSSKYNMVFSTYSQVQTVKGKSTPRRQFLEQIAPQSILVLDEAHEAGGSAKKWEKSDAPADRALFTRRMVDAAEGVFFASATATKRPDVMDLYSTRMNVAEVTSVSGLQSTLEEGGTPLQQVATAMMAEDGQYTRRSRTYAGIDVNSTVVPTTHEDADQLSAIMRSILEFDMLKQKAVKEMNKEAQAEAKRIAGDAAIGVAGAQSTNFSSIMWNVVDQAGLARKADAVADLAISSLEGGERPFIGLSNTMGSFIEKYASEMDIKPGDAINVNFQDVLERYLERSRDITTTDYTGEGYRRPMTDAELGEAASQKYEETAKMIDQATFTNMPVSPIDWIRHRVESAGYTFGELTGRGTQLEYSDDGSATFQRRGAQETSKAAKIAIISGFNSGRVDIGLGNRSASTGYSMHSSSKFENQERRHFIIAQPERDINVFKQFLGRFDRTGQVNAPKLSLVVGDTPDEKRPAAVLAKKLTTLNANTTAAVKGGVDFEGIPDYFNEVGDQIVTDFIRDDSDFSKSLFDPISISEYDIGAVEGAAAKVTGRLPILPVAEQEEFYQQLDMEYQSTLARYKAMGENPLEASGINLDARTLASVEVISEAAGVDSAFARGIRAEVVDVLVQSKPKTQLEVINDVRRTLEMKPVRAVEDHDADTIDIASSRLVDQLYQQTEQITERYLAEQQQQYAQLEPDAEKLQGQIDKSREKSVKQLETLTKIKRYRPGRSVRMTSSNGRVFYGVVTNVRKRGKSLDDFKDTSAPVKENVAIPSRWEVVIAMADEQRQISLPLSKLNPAVETPDSFTVTPVQSYSKDIDIYQLFDQRQTGDREVRTILKGNLLRAADTSYLREGKLILASMSNGQMEPVILMKKGFNPQQEMEAAPVILPSAEKIEEFMVETQGAGIVKTTDESITLKRNQSGEFFIQTGKTRKDVYLDQDLLSAVGSEFTSVSDRMQAKFDSYRLEDVVGYLIKGKGKRLAAFTEQSTARKLLGQTIPELQWADSVESVVGREGLPPVVDLTDLGAVRQQLDETFKLGQSEQSDTPEPSADSSAEHPEAQTSLEEVNTGIPPTEEATTSSTSEAVETQGEEELQTEEQEEATPTSPQDAGHRDALPIEPPAQSIEPETAPAAPEAADKFELQRVAAHRLLCEKRVVRFLNESTIAPHLAGEGNFHLRIENEPYLPLVVEAHHIGDHKDVYLTHYREQNGDLIRDGEMVFKLQENGHLSFEEVAVQSVRGGELRDYDKSFAAIFSQNIIEQGFAESAREQLVQLDNSSTQAGEAVLPALEESEQADVGTVEQSDSLEESDPAVDAAAPGTNYELQPLDQHQLPCEQQAVQFLRESGIAPELTGNRDFHIEIENEPWLPLTVAATDMGDHKEVALTHYVTEADNLSHDGELVFRLSPGGHLSFEETAKPDVGIRSEVRGEDQAFATSFIQNLSERGFTDAAKEQMDRQEFRSIGPAIPEPPAVDTEVVDSSTQLKEGTVGAQDEPDLSSPTDELLGQPLEDLDFVEQLIEEYDGDGDAIIDAIFDGEMQLPSALDKDELDEGEELDDETEEDEIPQLESEDEYQSDLVAQAESSSDFEESTDNQANPRLGDRTATDKPSSTVEKTEPDTLQPYVVVAQSNTAPPVEISSTGRSRDSETATPSSEVPAPEAENPAPQPYVVISKSATAPPVEIPSLHRGEPTSEAAAPPAIAPDRGEARQAEASPSSPQQQTEAAPVEPVSSLQPTQAAAEHTPRKQNLFSRASRFFRSALEKAAAPSAAEKRQQRKAAESQEAKGASQPPVRQDAEVEPAQPSVTSNEPIGTEQPANQNAEYPPFTVENQPEPHSTNNVEKVQRVEKVEAQKVDSEVPLSADTQSSSTAPASVDEPAVQTELSLFSTVQSAAVPPTTESVAARSTEVQTIQPSAALANSSTSTTVETISSAELERAINSSIYMEDADTFSQLEAIQSAHPDQPKVEISPALKERANANRAAATQKFRRVLAEDIVPMAQKILHTAEQAKLTTSRGSTTTFAGKNYTIAKKENDGTQEIKVRCHKTQGYIYAVNGKIERADNVVPKDRDVISRFASKTPRQLQQAFRKQKKSKDNGLAQ